MTRLLSSFFIILGLVGLVLFSKQDAAHASQDCAKYSNNPPYYERCMQIQKSIQRMNDSKAKRNKRIKERKDRVNKSFRSQQILEAQKALEEKKKESAEETSTNSEKTKASETTDKTADDTTQTPNTQTSDTKTAQGTSTDTIDPHVTLLKNIPSKHRIIIDSRKLTREQLATIYSILTQIRTQSTTQQPTTQQPTTAAPANNTQKPVTKTIRRPTRPMTPISPSGSKKMIKLPDVGMGDSGYAPIEPLDPNDLSRP